MKRKLLFLPDILLLLFICLSCERNEFRHTEFNNSGEEVVMPAKTNSITSEKEAEEKSWKYLQGKYLEHLAGFKAKLLKD